MSRFHRTISICISCTLIGATASAQTGAPTSSPNKDRLPKVTPEDIQQWRSKFYDATGTALATQNQLDWDYIERRKPSYAEQRGLVGAPTVQVRRNFVYVEDTDGTLNIPPRTQRDFGEWFNFAIREAFNAVPNEHVFVVLFTSFDTGIGAFFYQHQSNDVRGIGLPMFDNNGRANPTEGFIFMNTYDFFDRQWGQFGQSVVDGFSRHTFNQETGHRWLVNFTMDPQVVTPELRSMIGRMDGHWSYYMDSGASPIEGNWWRDNGNGTFTTRTSINNWRFNTLDLYLMGLLPPADVQPWFVINNPDNQNARDLTGRSPTPSSPPQIFMPVTIAGTRADHDINTVTSALGVRFPTVDSSPKLFKTLIVMLAGPQGLSEANRVRFEGMIDGYAIGFSEGTGGRASLDYTLMADPNLSDIGGPCNAPSDCDPGQANLCIMPAGSAAICSRGCQDAGICPQGWCCQPDSQGVPACHPANLCNAATPDGGTGTPDSGTTAPPVCACDLTTICNENCDCDPECFQSADCPCDLTTICDSDPASGGRCECDPECIAQGNSGGGGGLTQREGSSCATTGGSSLWLLAGLALVLARRRRR